MTADVLFFDLETKAHERIGEWVERERPNYAEIAAPSNWKDPEKIAAERKRKWKEAFLKSVDDQLQKIERGALDPDMGTIAALGYRLGLEGETTGIVVGEDCPDEKDLIESFWEMFKMTRGQVAGYNILNFDLPYLMRRSFDLGIRIPFRPNLARYRTGPVFDLYAILYNWGPGKSLKRVCSRYGIQVDVPDVDGSMVASLTNEELRAYVESDVNAVVRLFERMSGIYF